MSDQWEDEYNEFLKEVKEEESFQFQPDMEWEIDGMIITVKNKGVVALKISLGEAMEATHRYLVEAHIKEIERSPWIKNWHDLDGAL